MLENLIFSLQEDGTYKTIISAYNLTTQEINTLINGGYVDATDRLEMTIIEDSKFSSNTLNKVVYVDCITGTRTFWECSNGRAGHRPGSPGPPNCIASSFDYVIEAEWGSCSESVPNYNDTSAPGNSGSGGNGGSPPSNDYDGSDPDIHGNGTITSPNTGCRGAGCVEFEDPEEDIELVLNEELEINPYFLVDIDCDQIQHWQNLAQHTPAQSIIDKIEDIDQNNTTIFGDFDIQYIEDAEGAVVNMDYFPVVVDVLPTNPDTGQQFTPDGFLEYIRTNINDFVDISFSEFFPSDQTGYDEEYLWESTNPLSSILSIDIPGGHDGSIVCSDYNITSSDFDNDYWIFTTLEMPWGIAQGLDGPHPVSGNREFGYYYDPSDGVNGSYTFYTRGVDRFESQMDYNIAEYMETGQPFNGADNLWTSFQQKVQDFCNNDVNNGVANVAPQSIYRPNWNDVKEVLLGNKSISDLECD